MNVKINSINMYIKCLVSKNGCIMCIGVFSMNAKYTVRVIITVFVILSKQEPKLQSIANPNVRTSCNCCKLL